MEVDEIDEIRALVDRLRAQGRALDGDGFGHIGHLKSAHKKICKQLEEFAAVLEMPMPKVAAVESLNPHCFGFGAGDEGNVSGCQCKKIFESYSPVSSNGRAHDRLS